MTAAANENLEPNTMIDGTIFVHIREAYWKAKKESMDPHDIKLRKLCSKMGAGSGANPAINRALVPFEIRMGPYGRGLFATNKVPKGTRVWECDLYGIFKTKEEWFAFLSALPQKYHEDVFEWSYVMDWKHELGTHVVGLDLDEASLINHGGGSVDHDGVKYDQTNKDTIPSDNNLGYDYDEEGVCRFCAVCDIAANEELLCDYSSFHMYDHPLTWWENQEVPQSLGS